MEAPFFAATGFQWPSCLYEWTLETRKNSEKLCFEHEMQATSHRASTVLAQ